MAKRLICCIFYYAVFNIILIISRYPVHLSMLSWGSFDQYSTQYSFQATGCFPTQSSSKKQKMDNSKRGIHLAAISIVIPGKNISRAKDSNQRPLVLKFSTLPTELRTLADKLRLVHKGLENIVLKGENAVYQHFLL